MDLLLSAFLGTPVWMWVAFLAIVAALLVLDLGLLHRRQREIGVAESLALSAFYIALALGFGAWVWHQLGAEAGLSWLTGFVVEKSLAIDNVFVIAMIFTHLAIPRSLQHRVLFWGIVGVIVLRAIMIGLGAAAVQRWSEILYLFAAILIFTGIKMMFAGDQPYDPSSSRIQKWVRRRFPVTQRLHGDAFFVRRLDPRTGRAAWAITPLFVALLMVEIADIVFAVDSVPAIFAITTDPFLVYTSNIFAILGLRALYFALAAMVARFHYLKYALSVLLVFVGGKILAADALGLAKIPPTVSLSVTFAILAAGIGFSLWKTRPQAAQQPS